MAPFALDPALHAILRLALALLFLGASWHKLRDLAGFRGALAGYAILPERATGPAAAGLAAAELGVGVGLLLPGSAFASAVAAAALLSIYSGAIALGLLRGRRHIDCGCAGPGGGRPLSEGLVARNALLIAAAALCALPVGTRPLVWIDAVSAVGGLAALALLYGAIDVGLANGARLRELRGRA